MTSDNLFRDYPEVVFMISFFSVIFVLQKTVFADFHELIDLVSDTIESELVDEPVAQSNG